MPAIKPLDVIQKKWTGRASVSQDDYRLGVQNTTKDWAAETSAAAARYNEGVQAALSANRFEAGVSRAGNAKWKNNTLKKGPQRWASGVQLSGDAYAQGFARYRDVIQNTQLPARGPRGSAQNYERARVMGEALHQARVQS